MAEYNKPLPIPTAYDQPYWEGCKKHELMLQKCQSCGTYFFPARPVCSECWSPNLEWTKVSGKGEVFSWVVFHQLYHPGFKEELPYNVSLIQLKEGPRMMSNVIRCRNEDLKIGMPVEVVFEDITDEFTLPKFKPAEG